VIAPLVLAIAFFILFLVVEIFIAREPVLAPGMLKQKVPILVGISNFLVAACNFSVTYCESLLSLMSNVIKADLEACSFPYVVPDCHAHKRIYCWYVLQTACMNVVECNVTDSLPGLHLMPNSVTMSLGSLFAGWTMHKTGRYKTINMIFGLFPFIAMVLISFMKENSPPIQSWLSIVKLLSVQPQRNTLTRYGQFQIPLGFGNAVVMQTTLSTSDKVPVNYIS
jgi:hypothetical protein